MRIELADHPSTAVEEDEQRRRLGCDRLRRTVVPGAQRAIGALDLELAHATDLGLDGREHARLSTQPRANLSGRRLLCDAPVSVGEPRSSSARSASWIPGSNSRASSRICGLPDNPS
jgi:hypothetical protein